MLKVIKSTSKDSHAGKASVLGRKFAEREPGRKRPGSKGTEQTNSAKHAPENPGSNLIKRPSVPMSDQDMFHRAAEIN